MKYKSIKKGWLPSSDVQTLYGIHTSNFSVLMKTFPDEGKEYVSRIWLVREDFLNEVIGTPITRIIAGIHKDPVEGLIFMFKNGLITKKEIEELPINKIIINTILDRL